MLPLVAVTAVQVGWLLPVWTEGEPAGADLSLHLAEAAALERALRALDLDLWSVSANAGFPSAYYYQFLAQLLPVALRGLSGGALSLPRAFALAAGLALLLLPLSTYWTLRRLGARRGEALLAAVTVGCVAGRSPWGLGADSLFTAGLYTQAWAFVLFGPALAAGARYAQRGDGLRRAAALALLLALTHPLLALCLLLAAPLLPLGDEAQPWTARLGLRARRLGKLALLTAGAGSCFWLPPLVHRSHFGGFVRGESEHGLSLAELGLELARGELLDLHRPPLLTALAAAGLAFAGARRPVNAWFARQGMLFALVVAAGHALPFQPDELIPWSRFLAPLQYALAISAALTLAAAGRRVAQHLERSVPAAPALIQGSGAAFAVALLVLQGEHMEVRVRTSADLASERAELAAFLEFLRHQPPGRIALADAARPGAHWWAHLPYVYAGHPALLGSGGAALQSSITYRRLAAADLERQAADLGLVWLICPRDHPCADHAEREVFGTARFALHAVGPRSLWRAPPEVRLLREDERPSWYRARVEVPSGAPVGLRLLVSHHPGWRCFLDGRPAVVERDGDFMRVQVPPGLHKVELRFRRPAWSWILGFAGSLLLAARRRA